MRTTATYSKQYENQQGELELSATQLIFFRPKANRSGTFASFGLLGLLFSSKWEEMLAIPRADITSASIDQQQRLVLKTPSGEVIFQVEGPQQWVSALSPSMQQS
jgi:hypothetical protein